MWMTAANFRRTHSQWCIPKNGGGYTQRGVAKGLKVPCLFMIAEVSIRCPKKPGGWYTPYTRVYPPQYTTAYFRPLFVLFITKVKSMWKQLSLHASSAILTSLHKTLCIYSHSITVIRQLNTNLWRKFCCSKMSLWRTKPNFWKLGCLNKL